MGYRLGQSFVIVNELAPDMGHAGDLADGTGAVEIVEPGIAISMHPPSATLFMMPGFPYRVFSGLWKCRLGLRPISTKLTALMPVQPLRPTHRANMKEPLRLLIHVRLPSI